MPSASPRSLADLLQNAQLPALPQSAIRLLELSQDPNNGPSEFAVPIDADPGLTSQVLKFVNSSYFGFSREISNVKLAITLVGIRTIKNFSLWSAVFSLMPNPKCGVFDLKCLWQDSLRRGIFARVWGKLMGLKDAEDLFAGALLQDMAVPLLAKELGASYAQVMERRNGGERRLSTLEQEAFGWDHAQAAAQMARTWSLPAEFARLIEQHTQIDQLLAAPKREIGPIAVALSSLLPPVSDAQWIDREKFTAAFAAASPNAGKTLAEVFAQVDKDYSEFAPVLKLAAPAKSLTQVLAETPAGVKA